MDRGAGHRGGGGAPLARALLVCLTAGLIWQFVLVAALVGYEQQTLRWSRIRPALWLQSPRSPRTGRTGGRTWLVILPLIAGFTVHQLGLNLPHPVSYDLGKFLSSAVGKTMFHGSWGWFAAVVTMWIFNTVPGGELLFRGLLLPRMNGAVLFAAYHVHAPWSIPVNLLDTLLISYPVKRFRSAWIGIAVHSAQTLVFTLLGGQARPLGATTSARHPPDRNPPAAAWLSTPTPMTWRPEVGRRRRVPRSRRVGSAIFYTPPT